VVARNDREGNLRFNSHRRWPVADQVGSLDTEMAHQRPEFNASCVKVSGGASGLLRA